MSIVASQYIANSQIDGRLNVTEFHTDHLGVVHHVHWIAADQTIIANAMAARVPLIEASLAATEVDANILEIFE